MKKYSFTAAVIPHQLAIFAILCRLAVKSHLMYALRLRTFQALVKAIKKIQQ
jgi:hypothetical protein